MDVREVHSGVKILALQPAKHYISTCITLIIHTVSFYTVEMGCVALVTSFMFSSPSHRQDS